MSPNDFREVRECDSSPAGDPGTRQSAPHQDPPPQFELLPLSIRIVDRLTIILLVSHELLGDLAGSEAAERRGFSWPGCGGSARSASCVCWYSPRSRLGKVEVILALLYADLAVCGAERMSASRYSPRAVDR